jgi:exportin-1
VAQEVLTTLKEHPDAWTRVDAILEFSSNQQTKYYALQILEQVIKTRWRVLPRNQCEGWQLALLCFTQYGMAVIL